ncbi:hypothetical protein ACO0LV_01810 [Pseudactinotalea sp. Z1739]|uniref:hypothetical protein n=1 Tax=Pseudactinotalea sp. Z1739 TaxID=3413028 RepID=UPI003C7EA80E
MIGDSADRVQAAMGIIAAMFKAKDPAEAERVGAALAALGLDAGELRDAQLLYFQGRDAMGGFEAEQVARLAYLVEHAPGAVTIQDAMESLTLEQLEEFNALTADDL